MKKVLKGGKMENIITKEEYISMEMANGFLKSSLSDKEIREKILEINRRNKQIYEEEKNKKRKPVTFCLPEKIITKKEEKIEKREEIDISFYIAQINMCTSLEEIETILPRREETDFFILMNTILSYYLKECKELEEFINQEHMSLKDRQKLKEEYQQKRNFLSYMITYRDEKKKIKKEPEKKNTLIYLTSLQGNYYILKDLKQFPLEYYDIFFKTLFSIKVGIFKNVKRLTNTNIGVLYEVKNKDIRILFDRFDLHTFIIVGAFIKKSYSEQYFFDFISLRAKKLKEWKRDAFRMQENEEEVNLLLERIRNRKETFE